MGEAEVALIVVTHDSEKWLGGFFESWLAAVAVCPVKYEMVVADSGSAVSPEGRVRELCAEARVVLCGNVGYGAAVNRGVAETRAEWIVFCNADVAFGGDVLKAFRKLVEGGLESGVVAPMVLNSDGSRQFSVGRFPTIGRIVGDQFRRREERKYVLPQPEMEGAIDWGTGACLVVHREAFEAVGGFDGKFFLYVEEVDFQKRLDAAGYSNRFVPSLCVTHFAPHAGREESGVVREYSARGLLRYFAKHGSWGQLFWFRVLGMVSGRLGVGEAFASRGRILEKATGP